MCVFPDDETTMYLSQRIFQAELKDMVDQEMKRYRGKAAFAVILIITMIHPKWPFLKR